MYGKTLAVIITSMFLLSPSIGLADTGQALAPDYRTPEVVEAEAYLSKSPTAMNVIKKIHARNVYYRMPGKNEDDRCEPIWERVGKSDDAVVIFWNPHMANMVDDGSSKMISPALLLVHEMIHANHYFEDGQKYEERSEKTDIRYDTQEEKMTIVLERKIAMELGEYQRETHHGRYIDVGVVTGK